MYVIAYCRIVIKKRRSSYFCPQRGRKEECGTSRDSTHRIKPIERRDVNRWQADENETVNEQLAEQLNST